MLKNDSKANCQLTRRQILATESLLKMLFIFLKKLFSFWRYLSFCSDFLVMLENGLIREIRLTSKYITSQPGEKPWQYTYCPISQEMKVIKQLNLVSIIWETFFLKTNTQSVVEKLVPGALLKYQNWAYLWSYNLPASFSSHFLKKNISHVIFC